MKDIKFRVWHKKEERMYYRGYQKWLWALLCEDDGGDNDGRGRPVKRASYADCVFLEGSGYLDVNHREVFEGDVVRVRYKDREFTDVVDSVPDMFGSRGVHPLDTVLRKRGITSNPQILEVEVLGNQYERPDLLSRITA
ncbi:MAG: hypothetical protein MOGMAGMI_02165 [Candidatus Omnitrophica bacterium]|nr:hypothetical protein [Candidatus Omnitrophota bacterium]